jgi:UDP-N-acetylmuramate--alanine ligase
MSTTRKNIQDCDEVIYSSAISLENPEYKLAKELGILRHRSDFLSQLFNQKQGIAVAGTHGKTSTSTMLSQFATELGLDPSFIVGGIVKYNNSNCRVGNSRYFIAEADESDKSFLKMNPYISIVSNIEEDHMDNYNDYNDVIETFRKYLENTVREGFVICNGDDNNIKKTLQPLQLSNIITFGRELDCDYIISDITIANNETTFLLSSSGFSEKLKIPIIGEHNIYNCTSAIIALLKLDIDIKEIKNVLLNYSGVARRLDLVYQSKTYQVFDDYAHHPTEVVCTLRSLRENYKNLKITAIFQPHRYTRTKQLWREFCDAFEFADKVYLLPVYAAGEYEISGYNSLELSKNIKHAELVQSLEDIDFNEGVYVCMGAGSISKMIRSYQHE